MTRTPWNTMIGQAALVISLFNLFILALMLRILIKYRMTITLAKRGLSILGMKGQQGFQRSVAKKENTKTFNRGLKNIISQIPFSKEIMKVTGWNEKQLMDLALDENFGPKLIKMAKVGGDLLEKGGSWIEGAVSGLGGLGKKKTIEHPMLGEA